MGNSSSNNTAPQPSNQEDPHPRIPVQPNNQENPHVPVRDEDDLSHLETELMQVRQQRDHWKREALRRELEQVVQERDHWKEVAEKKRKFEEASDSDSESVAEPTKKKARVEMKQAPSVAENLECGNKIPECVIPMRPSQVEVCRVSGVSEVSGYEEMEDVFGRDCMACVVWTRDSSSKFTGEVIWNLFDEYDDDVPIRQGSPSRPTCVENCESALGAKMQREGDCVDAYMHEDNGYRVRWTLTRNGEFTAELFEHAHFMPLFENEP